MKSIKKIPWCFALKVINNSNYKSYLFFLVVLIVSQSGFSQPSISSFSPTSGPVGTTVTINGTGFSTTPANNIVFFGAVKAAVLSASSTLLTVQVPVGATYQPITVTANNFTAYSVKPFVITFSGGSDLAVSTTYSFESAIESITDLHPNDIALSDFDGDGKTDIATSNNYSISGLPASVSILRNIGGLGNISFAPKLDIPTGTFTYGIAAADLNGDGKPDLISSSIADQKISIYKNISTAGNISFASKIDYPSQESPYRIAVNDIDGDGKPDIIVANNIFSSTVSVFRNTSSGGNISFASKIDFPSNTSPYAVIINDLDGDNKPDIAVCNDISNTVSILRNTSVIGNISFAQAKSFTTGKTPKGITSGDIDGDGKADIVTANYEDHSFSALRNISSVGNITFEPKKDFYGGPNPLSISMGDLNGDGKPDILLCGSSLAAVQNKSTTGSFVFGNSLLFYERAAPNVVGIGDLDGDGKNDLAGSVFTSEKVLLYRNKNNEPTVLSFSPTTATNGTAVTISGANFTNATEVSFGGVPALSFTLVSSTTITAIVGSGESGDVSVKNAYGSHEKSGFNYVGPPVISSFTPTSGNQQTPITITGKNFTGTTNVKFGGVPASSFTVVSSTTITAIAANGVSGYISVTNPYGTANAPGFTFIPPPTISSFTPTGGQAGTTVIINGSNFNGATEVIFGGNPAKSFSVLSSTSISATIADGGSGYIELITPGGKAKSSGMFMFPAPTITSFTPLTGNAGTTVTINGYNFRSNPSDNIVYFGAAKATVTSATNNRLTVIVPPGATPQPITVTTNKYTSYSTEYFRLTYPDGNGGIDSSSFTWKAAFRSYEDPRGILLSDLDGDGKTDLIVQNYFGGSISFLRNTSDNGSISFAPYQDIVSGLGTNVSSKIAVGDIDGDGKPDLVVTNAGSSVSIFKNTSQAGSISFASKIELQGDYFNTGLTLWDFDGDGKTDIAVTSQDFLVSTAKISIYKNITNNGIISFLQRVQFVAPDYAGDLATADVDGDGKADLVSSTLSVPSLVAVWRNASIEGNISFNPYQSFLASTSTSPYLAVGDIDDDGRPELLTCNYYAKTFSVLKNLSSNGTILFAPKIDYPVAGAPTFISLGQLDGDGRLDVAVVTEKKISVFRNTSSNSIISFAAGQNYSTLVTYNWIDRISVGDIDGDGKPDISATNGADNKVSIFKNRENKKIVNVCSGSGNLLSDLIGSSYQWQVNSGNGFINLFNDNIYNGTNTSTLQLKDISSSYNNYEYRCLVDGNTSSVFTIHIMQGLVPSVMIASSANNVCTGNSIVFTATPTNGGTSPSYQWKVNGINAGTNSNTFTTNSLNNNDQVSVILTSNASCVVTPTANSNIITVTVNPVSTPTVTTSVSANGICAGTSVTFTATPTNGGTTPAYQWQVNNVNTATNSNIFTSSSLNNNDQVKVTMTSNAGCITTPTATSIPITMIVNEPVKISGEANSPSQACAGIAYNVTFASSNTPNGSSVQLWENSNNGSFNSGSTQTYNGTVLNFPVSNSSGGRKAYFFKISPPAGNACFISNSSDTSITLVDQLAKPIIAVNASTITVTNADAGASYKWQIQNAGNWSDIVPLANGQTYTAVITGVYRVQASKGTCIESSEVQSITVTNPNPSNQSVVLYPNPTQGTLTLDSLKLADNWEILDIVSPQSGQTVASFNIANQTKITIRLDALSDGVYLAVLRRKDGSSISIKFLKI